MTAIARAVRLLRDLNHWRVARAVAFDAESYDSFVSEADLALNSFDAGRGFFRKVGPDDVEQPGVYCYGANSQAVRP
jgi:hypothetical protein